MILGGAGSLFNTFFLMKFGSYERERGEGKGEGNGGGKGKGGEWEGGGEGVRRAKEGYTPIAEERVYISISI